VRQTTLLIRFAYLTIVLLFCTSVEADRRSGDCGKVDDWMKVINEWSLNKDLNQIYHEHFRQLIRPAFHEDVLREMWGESYAEMSEQRRALIYKILNNCSTESWVRVFLTIPFSNPPARVKQAHRSDYAQWQAAIVMGMYKGSGFDALGHLFYW
jgi:hypothetical protein